MKLLTDKDFDDIEIEALIDCNETAAAQRFSYSQRNLSEAKEQISKYLKWFHKAKSFSAAPFLLGSCQTAIRKLQLNLLENCCMEQHIRNEVQVNSNCNMVEAIRKYESMHNYANEALIKTYPSENFIGICKKFQQKTVPSELQSIKQCDVERCSSSQKFIDSIDATDYDSKEKVYGRIVIPFLTYRDDLSIFEKNAIELVKLAKARGYFLTQKDIIDVPASKQPIVAVYLAFEAKYSKHCIKLNDTLVHCTSIVNLPKINHVGLQPKAKTKGFFTEDTRVYFFNNCKHYEIDNYAHDFIGDEFAMLQIKKQKLEAYPQYASGKMRFFTDPRLQNLDDEEMPLAVYTYEPIPRSLIEDAVSIVKFRHGMKSSVEKVDLRDF